MKRKAPYVSHDEEQIREFRARPKLALEYLNSAIKVAFEEGDSELVLTALAAVAKAYGIGRVAKGAQVRRESLHRMLSRRGNPEWRSMFRVLRALHVRPRFEAGAGPRH
ncbi:MAG: putative addiction module antidote protein [Elusimicrobia bacterium]|nr:putative addiction module antidote protein [Elusimicrobiota bacterium]